MNGVSVIMCCYNSVSRLESTLTHLSKQINCNFSWEIIVVNNASTDETGKVVKEIWDRLTSPTPLKVIDEPIPGLSNARAAGIRDARFEYLLFCDDDNWLSENYVSLTYKTLETNPAIGVLGGRNRVVADVSVPDWFYSFQGYYAVGCQSLYSGEVIDRNFVFGAGMAFRKSVFNRFVAAGFNHLLNDRNGSNLMSGGDLEICYFFKINGYKIWYEEDLSLEHYMPIGRLNKNYLENLKKGAAASVEKLQVYDPYIQGLSKSKKKVFYFFYYLFRFATAGLLNKNTAHYLTYLEATNLFPVTINAVSRHIRKTIKIYDKRLKSHPKVDIN